MPPTAPVTTTGIQGVTTQADIQGEWWSQAQSQNLIINSRYIAMEGVMSHYLLVILGLAPYWALLLDS